MNGVRFQEEEGTEHEESAVSRNLTSGFKRPSDESLRKVIDVLRKAMEGRTSRQVWLAYDEVVGSSKLSEDTVSRCLKFLRDQRTVEGLAGEWCLVPEVAKRMEKAEAVLEELRVQETIALNDSLLEAMLGRVSEFPFYIPEIRGIAEKLAPNLAQYRDKPRILSKVLAAMRHLNRRSLELQSDEIRSIVLENIEGQPMDEKDRFYYDEVFANGLSLLDRLLYDDEKLELHVALFREALRTDRSIGEKDARGYILSLVPDKKLLLKRMIRMSRVESDRKLKSKIDEVIRDFEFFTRQY